MSKLKDILKDILKTTSCIAIDEVTIKNDNDKDKASISFNSKDAFVVAYTKEKINEFNGTLGFFNVKMLEGIINTNTYDQMEIQVVENKNLVTNTTYFSDFLFKDGKNKINYKLVDQSLLKTAAKQMTDVQHDICIKSPAIQKINEFSNYASILRGINADFKPAVEGTDLLFYMGDSDKKSNSSAHITFAEGVSGKLESNLKFPIGLTLNILKLSEKATVELKFFNFGALMITVDTGLVDYYFLIRSNV